MVSGEVSTRILDHIVHLTPPGSLAESVEAFRALGFTVTPGGTHADGLTANALVVFADGIYLELLHFTRPLPAGNTHPWGTKEPGWIDFAFLGNGGTPSVAATINARAAVEGSAARYAAEVRGGRTREDGRVLEWLISAPLPAEGEGKGEVTEVRGRLPFFCGDLTPRKWRVPLEPLSNSEHANTATGIAHVKLLATSEGIQAYAKQLTSVLGVSPRESSGTSFVWELEKQPLHNGAQGGTPVLILSAPTDDEEREHLQARGAGVYELGVALTDASKVGVARTPYGRVVFKAGDGV
ncbi:glyoxalase-like domain-containing protein [Lenzites betulinus]|nr:glyoxalase-like domain-containing protein [Lenzites betulinus]